MKAAIENFFYHYKYHVIGVIFALVLIISGFKSCSDKQVIDLKMVYFSDRYLSDESMVKIEDTLREDGLVADIDGDGERTFFLDRILYDFDVDGNTDEATLNKVLTIAYAGDHTLMLAHEYALEDYDGSFEDIGFMADEDDDTYYGPESRFVTGISVENNEYLESMGIDTQNLYLAMRRRTDKDKENKDNQEYFDHAYKVMEYILDHEVNN